MGLDTQCFFFLPHAHLRDIKLISNHFNTKCPFTFSYLSALSELNVLILVLSVSSTTWTMVPGQRLISGKSDFIFRQLSVIFRQFSATFYDFRSFSSCFGSQLPFFIFTFLFLLFMDRISAFRHFVEVQMPSKHKSLQVQHLSLDFVFRFFKSQNLNLIKTPNLQNGTSCFPFFECAIW